MCNSIVSVWGTRYVHNCYKVTSNLLLIRNVEYQNIAAILSRVNMLINKEKPGYKSLVWETNINVP